LGGEEELEEEEEEEKEEEEDVSRLDFLDLDLDLDRPRFLSFLGDFLRSFLEDLEDFFSSLSAFRFVPAIGIGWWGGRLGWGWVGGWGWGWGRGWGLQFYIYLWWSPNGMKKLHKKISAS